MHHVFITRLAVDMRKPKKSNFDRLRRMFDTIEDRIDNIITYWQEHASQFYTNQTIDSPFTVYLVYSPVYESVVRSYSFPEWAIPVTVTDLDRITHPHIYDRYDMKSLSVSRLDADDWYANDYFEYLERDHEIGYIDKQLTIHLHKFVNQYNRSSKLLSGPVRFSSPGFASITFNEFRKSYMPVNMRLWPHGSIKKYKHQTPTELYGIQSVGLNVVNKWRHNNVTVEPDRERYYIPI
jgi:hypothetical protein